MKLSTNFESMQSGLEMPDYVSGEPLRTRLDENEDLAVLRRGSQLSLLAESENELPSLEWDASLAIQSMLRRSMRYEHGAHP